MSLQGLRAVLGAAPKWYATCVGGLKHPKRLHGHRHGSRRGTRAVTSFQPERRHEEDFLGYHIRERDGIYIAVPLQWANGRGETIVSTDLVTLRDEIRRWWFKVGNN